MQICSEMFLNEIKSISVDPDVEKCFIKHVLLVAER